MVVRGAFNVATTTLKPRRALIAEISRALVDAGITFTLCRSVFKCKVDESTKEPESAKEEAQEQEKEKEEKEVLKFEVEVCRVAGLEMLLGVRFQRVVGNSWEYQEMCKKLITRMKL